MWMRPQYFHFVALVLMTRSLLFAPLPTPPPPRFTIAMMWDSMALRVARIVVSVLVEGEGARTGAGEREKSWEAGGVGDLDYFAATAWCRYSSIMRERAVRPSLILSVMRSSRLALRMLVTLL